MIGIAGKLTLIGIVIAVIAISPIVYATDSIELSVSMSFSESDLDIGKIGEYDIVRLHDGYYSGDTGEPMIATKVIKVALPDGMRAKSVSIGETESIDLDGEFNIYPLQPERRIGYNDDIKFIEPRPEIYESSDVYPGKLAELIGQTDLAGQAMALIRLWPIQYVPSAKKLILYENLQFIIAGEAGYVCGDYLPKNSSDNIRNEYQVMVEEMVINPEAVRVRTMSNENLIAGVDPGDYDYVIVTSSSYVSYFQPLANWKNKKGVRSTIVTTSWIYNSGGYTGTNADKIQQFFADAYATWGARYFLLGGDTGIIPAHSRYVYGEYVANDSYYADFDNDWICEAYVGRASVVNSTQINVFIDKVLTYEKNPPLTNYALKAALFGFDLDDYTDGEDCKIYIDNSYIPSSWTMTNVYDSHGGDHETNVKSAFNSGQNLINHIDHCNAYFLGTGTINHYDDGLTTSEVDAFYNGDRQSIFYTIGCHANAYDETYCISEHMMRDGNGGSVGYVGNSRNGLYWQGDTDYYSFKFDKYFFRSLFVQNHYNLGKCFSDHKNDVSISNETWQYLFTGLTLLGDPEMPIWTDQPEELVVEHAATVPIGESVFTVHVEDNYGAAVYLALVCLSKGNEVYLTGYTNSSGDVSFSPEPTSLGTMDITATKQNYLPEESSATVIDPLGSVAGVIRNYDMELQEGVVISCSNPALDTVSDANGEYELYGFETGTYDITFSHPSYMDTTVTGIAVTEGETATLNMILSPYADDVGVSLIFSPDDTIIVDSPSPISCEVTNFGLETNSFNVIFQAQALYSSNIEFTASFNISNMPGGTVDTVNFSEYFEPSMDTVYNVSIYTTLADDMNSANDAVNSTSRSVQGVTVWYGDMDQSPIIAYIGNTFEIDVYANTSEDVYVGDIHLCLGAMDDYISDFLSHTEGGIYYPLTEWDLAEFFEPQVDPNPPGWTSQSFWGLSRLSSAGAYIPLEDTPWLHLDAPARILTFVLEAMDDSTLAGGIIDCLGPGLNFPQGPSNAGDTIGGLGYKLVEFYSPVMFRSSSGACDFVPGDVNSDGLIIGSDVTFLVNYFRGAAVPPDSCWNDLTGEWLYSAADANGDCQVIGSDVTFLVNYFRGVQAEILWCIETPPLGPTLASDKKGKFPEINYPPGTE